MKVSGAPAANVRDGHPASYACRRPETRDSPGKKALNTGHLMSIVGHVGLKIHFALGINVLQGERV